MTMGWWPWDSDLGHGLGQLSLALAIVFLLELDDICNYSTRFLGC